MKHKTTESQHHELTRTTKKTHANTYEPPFGPFVFAPPREAKDETSDLKHLQQKRRASRDSTHRTEEQPAHSICPARHCAQTACACHARAAPGGDLSVVSAAAPRPSMLTSLWPSLVPVDPQRLSGLVASALPSSHRPRAFGTAAERPGLAGPWANLAAGGLAFSDQANQRRDATASRADWERRRYFQESLFSLFGRQESTGAWYLTAC